MLAFKSEIALKIFQCYRQNMGRIAHKNRDTTFEFVPMHFTNISFVFVYLFPSFAIVKDRYITYVTERTEP